MYMTTSARSALTVLNHLMLKNNYNGIFFFFKILPVGPHAHLLTLYPFFKTLWHLFCRDCYQMFRRVSADLGLEISTDLLNAMFCQRNQHETRWIYPHGHGECVITQETNDLNVGIIADWTSQHACSVVSPLLCLPACNKPAEANSDDISMAWNLLYQPHV